MTHNVVIIGAGPAGMSAAIALVEQGIHPTVIDENSKSGGQIYRQQPENFTRTKKQLYGFDAKEAEQALKNWQTIEDKITYLPRHMVWNASGQTLCLFDEVNSTYKEIAWDSLIIATGATDRILPFKGWTLPGVYTLGAAQIALKNQGCTIGSDVVIAGNGPLLYLLAWQYLKAGANIKAILDYSSFADQCKSSLKLIHAPKVMLKGLYYLASLKRAGVKIIHNARLNEAEGDNKVTGIKWNNSKAPEQTHHITCNAIAFGYGLRSETQLADLLGCQFHYHPIHHDWLPVLNEQQTSIPDLYMTGDNSGISGVYAAQISGKKAANQILNKLGLPVSNKKAKKLNRQLNHLKIFSHGLAQAFPFPELWAQDVSDDTVVCRCENITAGDIRTAIKTKNCTEINQLKAHSRSGMGRCQGRVCSTAIRELLAYETNNNSQNVGRIRSQSPLKPIPIVINEELADEAH
ncbi:NAD(P)/FAD-dependent oxidoreductase [Vibrio salinus]|uniref:NAD(P)/FAD-dependent oxidoreductase n=1 Tax=Vibrio salinus TaxID=2899784 RepID=UPI001E58BBD2|nr:NAD(P)/FAD-dependent oxidoreductase [Vibrio salinus]MCE0495263.1 FAD-dependent oxidoreductase [Vibrio salinus]